MSVKQSAIDQFSFDTSDSSSKPKDGTSQSYKRASSACILRYIAYFFIKLNQCGKESFYNYPKRIQRRRNDAGIHVTIISSNSRRWSTGLSWDRRCRRRHPFALLWRTATQSSCWTAIHNNDNNIAFTEWLTAANAPCIAYTIPRSLKTTHRLSVCLRPRLRPIGEHLSALYYAHRLCSQKYPILFSGMTPRNTNQFARKF